MSVSPTGNIGKETDQAKSYSYDETERASHDRCLPNDGLLALLAAIGIGSGLHIQSAGNGRHHVATLHVVIGCNTCLSRIGDGCIDRVCPPLRVDVS